jgi:hypothetical protein
MGRKQTISRLDKVDWSNCRQRQSALLLSGQGQNRSRTEGCQTDHLPTNVLSLPVLLDGPMMPSRLLSIHPPCRQPHQLPHRHDTADARLIAHPTWPDALRRLRCLCELRRRSRPNETTYAFSNGQQIRVRRLKKMMPNKMLAGVGYDDLAALVSKAASRPVSKSTKERISVMTAVARTRLTCHWKTNQHSIVISVIGTRSPTLWYDHGSPNLLYRRTLRDCGGRCSNPSHAASTGARRARRLNLRAKAASWQRPPHVEISY